MAKRLNDLEKALTIPSKYHATLERCKLIENNSSLQGDSSEMQARRYNRSGGDSPIRTVAKAVRVGRDAKKSISINQSIR